jgi:aryl-alcohol dehydrogenase-like predicted oxidoreductase
VGSEAADERVIEQVAKLALDRGLPRAQIALAWLLHQPVVTSPIVGASREEHLKDAVAALDLTLSKAELEFLEAPYIPHAVAGHS